jgi:hypothetical protein
MSKQIDIEGSKFGRGAHVTLSRFAGRTGTLIQLSTGETFYFGKPISSAIFTPDELRQLANELRRVADDQYEEGELIQI